MRWVGHVACMTAKINAYKIFIQKPEGRILFIRVILKQQGRKIWTGFFFFFGGGGVVR